MNKKGISQFSAVLSMLIIVCAVALVFAIAKAQQATNGNGVSVTVKTQPGEAKKENAVVNSEDFTLLSTQNFPKQLDYIEVVRDKKTGEEYLVFFSDTNLFVMRRENGGTNGTTTQ